MANFVLYRRPFICNVCYVSGRGQRDDQNILKLHCRGPQSVSNTFQHFLDKCDRIWENPPYGINVQFAQCTFLVPRVKNCQSSDFVIYMSKNLSSVTVVYGG